MKIGLEQIPPFGMRALSAGCGALTLYLVCLARRRSLRLPTAKAWAHVIVASLLNIVGFSVLSAFAQIATATSRVTIVAYTLPIWSVLLAWPLLGERPTGVQGLALGLCITGLAILIYPLAGSAPVVRLDRRQLQAAEGQKPLRVTDLSARELVVVSEDFSRRRGAGRVTSDPREVVGVGELHKPGEVDERIADRPDLPVDQRGRVRTVNSTFPSRKSPWTIAVTPAPGSLARIASRIARTAGRRPSGRRPSSRTRVRARPRGARRLALETDRGGLDGVQCGEDLGRRAPAGSDQVGRPLAVLSGITGSTASPAAQVEAKNGGGSGSMKQTSAVGTPLTGARAVIIRA